MTNPLPRATPESHGLESRAIEAFLDEVAADNQLELHSLMILRHGHVLAEGWWRPYTPDNMRLLYSLSKSFTSVAFGVAMAEGGVALDDRLVDVFPEHRDAAADDRVRALTMRHLLRMATGHRADALPRAYQADPDDLVRGFLMVPPDEDPGTIFAYNNAATYVVAAAVQKLADQRLVEYLRPRLFEPLGIERAQWQYDPSGRDLGFSGLYLTTESVAKFGQLLVQGGRWDGHQLLDPGWLAEATSAQTPTHEEHGPDWHQGYGYQFWMARHGYRGDGAYAQFCLVLPEHDLVIVMMSATEVGQRLLDAAWQHILPSLMDNPVDGASTDLQERLQSLELHPNRHPVPADQSPVRVVKAVPADTVTHVTIEQDPLEPGAGRQSVTFACGTDVWNSDVVADGEWRLPYAAAGTWSSEGVFDADVVFTQTPHRLRLRYRADGPSESGWVTQPLGPPSPAFLATPADT